ncbi:hypothetical protein ACRQ84_20690 (plasmid) [Enterobacter ludwigii]
MRLFEQKVARKGVYHSLFTSFYPGQKRQEIRCVDGYGRRPLTRQLLLAAAKIAGDADAAGNETTNAH